MFRTARRPWLAAEDTDRMAELVDTYADLRLGGVDASVVAVAERLNVATVATLNRRDSQLSGHGTSRR